MKYAAIFSITFFQFPQRPPRLLKLQQTQPLRAKTFSEGDDTTTAAGGETGGDTHTNQSESSVASTTGSEASDTPTAQTGASATAQSTTDGPGSTTSVEPDSFITEQPREIIFLPTLSEQIQHILNVQQYKGPKKFRKITKNFESLKKSLERTCNISVLTGAHKEGL
ncbi:hypothetical protein GCK32_017671 [Trichostrongylus colubriformis]|uniref:Uncharacterized protein n=1 Tax=Trichostrongylus colubriformis TaxID=6319 RepID=A0AAN8ETR6_TRICO